MASLELQWVLDRARPGQHSAVCSFRQDKSDCDHLFVGIRPQEIELYCLGARPGRIEWQGSDERRVRIGQSSGRFWKGLFDAVVAAAGTQRS